MKICICIAGQARINEVVLSSFRTSIWDPIVARFPETYLACHFWTNKTFDRYRWEEGEAVDADQINTSFSYCSKKIIHTEPPRNFFVEQRKINVPLKEAGSYESQYFSLEKSKDAMQSLERDHNFRFDVLIKTRIDLIYRDIFNPSWIEQFKNTVAIPEREGHKWRGDHPPDRWNRSRWLPDQFWLGNRDSVEYLMSFRQSFKPSYFLRNEANNIEVMLKRHWTLRYPNKRPSCIPFLFKIERTTNNK